MKSKSASPDQGTLAEKFHHLHHATNTLILANAWDCASAKLFEEVGFPAIATTSSGISFSCGYQDGEHIPPALMLEVINRITRVVNIPVTADIEGGYTQGDAPSFSTFINDLLEAGAVGINLEDSHSSSRLLNEINVQQELIRTAKEAGKRKGINLFVNARTDALMLGTGDLQSQIQICIERAKAFEEAGADGIFIPFAKEMKTISTLKKGISLPLNILIEDGLDIATLKGLKVNRLSTGSKPILATMSLLKKIATDLQTSNQWDTLHTIDTTYAEMNKWFE